LADFNEIADQLKTLLDRFRDDPAQVIDPDGRDIAIDIVRNMQMMTQEQLKFAKSLGHTALVTRNITLQREKQITLAQLQSVATDQERAHLQSKLDLVQTDITHSKELLDLVNELTEEYGQEVLSLVEMDKFTKRLYEVELQKADLLEQGAGDDAESFERAMKRLELEEQVVTQLQIGHTLKKKEEKLAETQEEFLGFSVKGISKKIEEIGETASTAGARIAIMGGVLKIALGKALGTMKELHETGLSVGQTFAQYKGALQAAFTGDGITGFIKGFGRAGPILRGTQALAETFADLTFQTSDMQATVGRFHQVLSLSADEAAQLAELLVKQEGLTAAGADAVGMQAKAFGKINKLNPGQVFKAIADNAAIFARFGAKGAQSFFQAVGYAKRLGVNLESLDRLGDTFLDIDTLFQNVSRLRMFGMDVPDVRALAVAAETDDPRVIAEAFGRALQNIDLENLGRTRRGILEDAFGTTLADLKRYKAGIGPEGEGAEARVDPLITASQEQVESMGSLTNGLDANVSILLELAGLLSGQNLAMIALTAATIAQTIATIATSAGGMGGILGSLKTIGGSVLGGLAAGAGTAIAGFGGALLATTAGIETINKVFDTDIPSMYDFVRIKQSEASEERNRIEGEQLRELNKPLREAIARGASQAEIESIKTDIRRSRFGEATAVGAPAAADVTAAEPGTPIPEVATREQFNELLGIFHEGFVVNIDGRQAGRLLRASAGEAR